MITCLKWTITDQVNKNYILPVGETWGDHEVDGNKAPEKKQVNLAYFQYDDYDDMMDIIILI